MWNRLKVWVTPILMVNYRSLLGQLILEVGAITQSVVLRVTLVMSSQTSAHHVWEMERDFLPSPSRGAGCDGGATASLPSLCQGRGNAVPIVEPQRCREVSAPLSTLVFWKRSVEKRWSTILTRLWALLSLDLDAFDCSCLMFSRARGGKGWAETRICLLIFFLPPFSKYRGFGASFSMGTGIKTDISKYFPVVTWVPTAVLVSWKSREVIPSLRKKPSRVFTVPLMKEQLHSVMSVQEQLLTAHFPFLPWTLRLLLAHSPAAKHRGSAPLSAAALDQRNGRKTDNTKGVFARTQYLYQLGSLVALWQLQLLAQRVSSWMLLQWGPLNWKGVTLLTELCCNTVSLK